MAANDVVLVDSLVRKTQSEFPQAENDSELFELFVFNQLLKSYEPSIDELESGWTDGGNDGGIDGFFVYVDQRPATPEAPDLALKRHPTLAVHIVSVRRSPTFEQQPIDSLTTSLKELFDLRLSKEELSYPYNDLVVEQRELFRSIFVALADRQPRLEITVTYCSRGDRSKIAPNLLARARTLEAQLREQFGAASIDVEFVGASELLALCRKSRNFSVRLPLVETPITRDGKNFLTLCQLSHYFNAIRDDAGQLKRYLFESNVRDFLGDGRVNSDILATLRRKEAPEQGDFWWLNNGVTMLATDARVVAKELLVENAQIVNGLQTTETLFNYFAKAGSAEDNRTILVKVIVAADDDMRARIIKATNYQNTIALSDIRGLDKIQRDIDHFLFDHGWFYDRRKNYYKNQGKPADRIVSVAYVASAVRAIALGDPARWQSQRAKSLRDDTTYHSLFNESWDLRVYLACVEITRAVEKVLHSRRSVWDTPPMTITHHIGFAYVCQSLGKFPYKPDEIVPLAGMPPSPEKVAEIRTALQEASRQGRPGRRYEGIVISKSFIEDFVSGKFNN